MGNLGVQLGQPVDGVSRIGVRAVHLRIVPPEAIVGAEIDNANLIDEVRHNSHCGPVGDREKHDVRLFGNYLRFGVYKSDFIKPF